MTNTILHIQYYNITAYYTQNNNMWHIIQQII